MKKKKEKTSFRIRQSYEMHDVTEIREEKKVNSKTHQITQLIIKLSLSLYLCINIMNIPQKNPLK
ncbi:Isocitrate dehydrogenase [NAD] subunit gamma 1, mitochondrial, variant 3 [Dermatophagoides farinae]|uniref:Isocitrate dehydrogenase [NAD] subunit gamma 1, mitochondrial, variant 3 n=1 Tax=Dermatophagoides farinae TaxID=6954 RepID=A0A922L6C0_DERFA|nr:Isocitrate dehydrogenase [NAD] subunit gamma 1, mitochondrial, variant 3 [Dermatophagoides farinae]